MGPNAAFCPTPTPWPLSFVHACPVPDVPNLPRIQILPLPVHLTRRVPHSAFFVSQRSGAAAGRLSPQALLLEVPWVWAEPRNRHTRHPPRRLLPQGRPNHSFVWSSVCVHMSLPGRALSKAGLSPCVPHRTTASHVHRALEGLSESILIFKNVKGPSNHLLLLSFTPLIYKTR